MRPVLDHRTLRSSVVAAGVLAACFLVIYLFMTHYDVTMDAGDAAEFQIIGSVGGVPHQPYPLWCILSNAAARLPFGEPAFRVTLLSVVCAAVAVGLLLLLIAGVTRDVTASVVAAAAFGLSHAFWQIAVVAEVYALNTLLQIVFLLLLLNWCQMYTRSSWFLLMLATGFLVSHHQVNIAVFAPLTFLLYRSRREIRSHLSARDIGVGGALFVLPFTLYLYTFIASSSPLMLNWYDNQGQYLYADRGFDPDGFSSFWEKLRFQMWPARYGEILQTPAGFAERGIFWIRHLVSLEFPFLGPLLMFAGFVSLWRAGRSMAVFWILFILAYAVLALNYLSGGGLTYIYSIPIYVVLALWLAKGLALRQRLGRRAAPVLVVLALLLVALPVLRHVKGSPFARFLRSTEGIAEVERGDGFFWHLVSSGDKGDQYGRGVAEAVPANSMIFAKWAEGNVLLYHKLVGGTLPHVDVRYVLPRKEYMVNLIRAVKPERVFFAVRPDSLGFHTVEVVEVDPGRRLYRVDVTDIVTPKRR